MTNGADRGPSAQMLSDGKVVLRSSTREDIWFFVEASADPAIREYNGDHDRQEWPAPLPTPAQAQTTIANFGQHLDAFVVTGIPTGVVFLIEAAASGEPVGCCGVDSWTGEDVAQVGYWLAPSGRGRGYATRALVLLTTWLFELGAARGVPHGSSWQRELNGSGPSCWFVEEGTMRSHAVWKGRRRDVSWFAALPSEWRRGPPR